MSYNTITAQQQNKQIAPEPDVSKVPFLNGMDAQGNPVKISPFVLALTPSEFNQQVAKTLSDMQSRVQHITFRTIEEDYPDD